LDRSHIDVVLNEPQKPENIGAAARAISNTGLGRLIVVKPRTLNPELMKSTATVHALGVLEAMEIKPDLRSALEPYQLVVGTTTRAGARRGPRLSPRQLAPSLLTESDPPKTALLFGPERAGLTTADLRLCHNIVGIPTASAVGSSLNLAQAVLILGYELLLAAGGEPSPPPAVVAADQKTLALMYDELESTLVEIGFLPPDNPGHWLMNFKKIFNRSQLELGECDMLMGLCRQIRWAVNNLDELPERRVGLKPGASASSKEKRAPRS
jgi:tRNA/rRNA methyltransferase